MKYLLDSSAIFRALQLKITFYDAAYAYFAKTREMQLVTEDSRLIKKLTPSVAVSTLDGME